MIEVRVPRIDITSSFDSVFGMLGGHRLPNGMVEIFDRINAVSRRASVVPVMGASRNASFHEEQYASYRELTGISGRVGDYIGVAVSRSIQLAPRIDLAVVIAGGADERPDAQFRWRTVGPWLTGLTDVIAQHAKAHQRRQGSGQ